jgi:uncharacterized protein YcfL
MKKVLAIIMVVSYILIGCWSVPQYRVYEPAFVIDKNIEQRRERKRKR